MIVPRLNESGARNAIVEYDYHRDAEEALSQLRMKSFKGKPIKVRYVNNTRYADYCFNCFSVQELSKAKLKSFMISYVKQCREGETLLFYRKKAEDGKYLVQGMNEGNEIVVQAAIELE